MDVTVFLKVTFREPDGDPEDVRTNTKTWLVNRLATMKNCHDVQVTESQAKRVLVKARPSGG